MENMGYLLAAFAVIWAVVFGYVIFMQRKQRWLQRQIDLIQQSADKPETMA
ncbi:CcmD family protein [Chloroflexota bacterium]